VRTLPNTPVPDGRAALHEKLREIQQDPEIISLARRRAGALDLADDALQEAYWAVARVKDPEGIEDLRAYFCRTLINQVKHLRDQFRATLAEDFQSLAEAHQGEVDCPAPPLVEETAGTLMVGQAWLERFSEQRAELEVRIPGRSSDPDLYRRVIIAVALQVLCAILNGHVSEADWDWSLRGAYSEWFAEEGCSPDNLYQRFSRGRADVRALLKIVINRDELS
jgi:DNA-directed RNA polymerase specialized sigma24 family protein